MLTTPSVTKCKTLGESFRPGEKRQNDIGTPPKSNETKSKNLKHPRSLRPSLPTLLRRPALRRQILPPSPDSPARELAQQQQIYSPSARIWARSTQRHHHHLGLSSSATTRATTSTQNSSTRSSRADVCRSSSRRSPAATDPHEQQQIPTSRCRRSPVAATTDPHEQQQIPTSRSRKFPGAPSSNPRHGDPLQELEHFHHLKLARYGTHHGTTLWFSSWTSIAVHLKKMTVSYLLKAMSIIPKKRRASSIMGTRMQVQSCLCRQTNLTKFMKNIQCT